MTLMDLDETPVVRCAEPTRPENAVDAQEEEFAPGDGVEQDFTSVQPTTHSESPIVLLPVHLTTAVEEQTSAGSQGKPYTTADVSMIYLGLLASNALQNLFQHSYEPDINKDPQHDVFISICSKVASLLIERDQYVIVTLYLVSGMVGEERNRFVEEKEFQTVYVCPTFLNVLYNA
jgi:hypothetical protein